MSGVITLQTYEGPQAAAQLDAILPLYEQVYAEPPYFEGPREVAEFLDRFGQQTSAPGFRLVTATSDSDIVGFTFGYLLMSNTQWWSGLLQSLPAGVTTETGHRTFVVIELAVCAPFRRRGIAAKLHAALLEGLVAERISLTVRPDAAPAQSTYASWGYRKIGQVQPWRGAPIYDAMVLNTKSR